MTDLTAAIDAAARALFEHLRNGNFADTEWEQLGPAWQEMWRGAIAAAAPIIETANDAEWCQIMNDAGERAEGEPFGPAVLAAVRADERQKVAGELRQLWHEQSSWLWYELGESALDKVAAYIAPRAEHREMGATDAPDAI